MPHQPFTYLLLLVNFFFTCLSAYSQVSPKLVKPLQYRLVQLNSEQGLPSEIVNVMIKDSKGFLWIGDMNGELTRYDGKNFKHYNYENRKHESFTLNEIITFREDSLGNIWIGSKFGLSRYNMMTDSFTNFVTAIDSASTIQKVIPIWATADEMYCIESDSWITAYNIHTLTYRRLLKISKEANVNFGFALQYSIFDVSTNSVWMLPAGTSGLIQLNLTTGEIKLHMRKDKSAFERKNGVSGAEGMRYDKKRNCIWINSHDGLVQFSLRDHQFRLVSAMKTFTDLQNYNRYVGIDIDNYGRIWLATAPKGILIYEPDTDGVQQLFTDKESIEKTGTANLHIYCDRDGIVWTSYWMDYGINRLLPYLPPVKRYRADLRFSDSLSHGTIYKTVPAFDGEIWVGTMDGLNILNTHTGKFRVLRQKDLPGLKGEAIIPLHVDTINHIAWLYAGPKDYLKISEMVIYEMNIQTRQCKPIVFRNDAKQFTHLGIDPGSVKPYQNGILVCTDLYGIFKIEPGKHFSDILVSAKSENGFNVFAIEGDSLIFLRSWAALPNYSFRYQEGRWVKIGHLLDSLEWQSMLFNDIDRSHWVSFKYSLVHYDKDFKVLGEYSKANGYASVIYRMLNDKEGNIWFINQVGQVGQVNASTGNISILSEADGYYKKDIDWSVPFSKDASGRLYVGTGYGKTFTGGLDVIIPERYSSAITSHCYLDSLIINHQPFPLAAAVNSLEELPLNYNQNSIKIVAGIIDYFSHGKSLLRYKLEVDNKISEWQYASNDTISFDDLLPGSYKLVVQSSNAGKEFNSPEKILRIIIHPPFWKTWWFRIAVFLAVVSLIYGIVQYRSRSLRQYNVILEEKVTIRNSELKKSLEELKETQTQLIHSEKMASLGELTAGIAHEIQNPLNFVNNFSDVNAELIIELKEEAEKGNIEEVQAIADDIADNEKKINHHGKRADEIVKNMLQHSRTGKGQKELTDINALVDEYLRLSYYGQRSKDNAFNATIEANFDESIGKVNIIPQDIGRVLLNLNNNAFYAVNEKMKTASIPYEPRVTVSTKRAIGKLEISVRDNGNGIPLKILGKVFQPFFTTKPTGQGTGLGLSISYDIVKAHGGELKVMSKEGEGSEFIILLPIV
jgi:signal transduction histidine kinase